MTTAAVSELLAGRRYSAIAFRHPSVDTFTDLTEVLGSGSLTRLSSGVPHVEARRLEMTHERNLNPSGSSLRDLSATIETKKSDQYRHWCMVGKLDLDVGPLVVFAAPYFRIVDKWASALRASYEAPRPSFAAPDLPRLFETLASSPGELDAREIALQVSGVPGVKTVTLKGDSPLISTLRKRIGEYAEPYGVRLQIARNDQHPLRLYIDRHGNLSWFQTSDAAFGVAMRVVQILATTGFLKGTYDVPTTRAEETERFDLW